MTTRDYEHVSHSWVICVDDAGLVVQTNGRHAGQRESTYLDPTRKLAVYKALFCSNSTSITVYNKVFVYKFRTSHVVTSTQMMLGMD